MSIFFQDWICCVSLSTPTVYLPVLCQWSFLMFTTSHFFSYNLSSFDFSSPFCNSQILVSIFIHYFTPISSECRVMGVLHGINGICQSDGILNPLGSGRLKRSADDVKCSAQLSKSMVTCWTKLKPNLLSLDTEKKEQRIYVIQHWTIPFLTFLNISDCQIIRKGCWVFSSTS